MTIVDIDGSYAVRNLIDSAVSYLTWHEDACKTIGFKGISQVWQEIPAWYFWMTDIAGGFLFRFHQEEPVNQSQYISLSLYYYPDKKEAAYQQLSSLEKGLIDDPEIIDQKTNTPKFESFEHCLPYFLSAEIGLLIDETNKLQALVFSSSNGQTHPTEVFFSFLVKTLNFYLKSHHIQAKQLNMTDISSLFVIYDTIAFEQFLKAYNIDKSSFVHPIQTGMLENWKNTAHLNAECSVNGACACH
jgi:hypothetical protein